MNAQPDMFGGQEDVAIPLAEQIDEVLRELAMRGHAYPRWIEQGSMTQVQADRQVLRMKAVLATLKSLQA